MVAKFRIDYRNVCRCGVSSRSFAQPKTEDLNSTKASGRFGRLPAWIHRGVSCIYPVTKFVRVHKSTSDRARDSVISRVVLSPELVFDVATVAVMPFYGLMIFGPRSRMTKSIIESSGAFFTLTAVLYGALLVLYDARKLVMPVVEAALSSAVPATGGPYMGALATIFKTHEMTAIVWLHLLVLDLFQARWVYLDSLKRGVMSWYSLVLCFMAGPLGLLSHFATVLQSHSKRFHTKKQIPAVDLS